MNCVTTYEDVWHRIIEFIRPIEMISIQFVNKRLNGYVKKNYEFINDLSFLVGHIEGKKINTRQDYINYLGSKLIKSVEFSVGGIVIDKYSPNESCNRELIIALMASLFLFIFCGKYKLSPDRILTKLINKKDQTPGELFLVKEAREMKLENSDDHLLNVLN